MPKEKEKGKGKGGKKKEKKTENPKISKKSKEIKGSKKPSKSGSKSGSEENDAGKKKKSASKEVKEKTKKEKKPISSTEEVKKPEEKPKEKELSDAGDEKDVEGKDESVPLMVPSGIPVWFRFHFLLQTLNILHFVFHSFFELLFAFYVCNCHLSLISLACTFLFYILSSRVMKFLWSKCIDNV